MAEQRDFSVFEPAICLAPFAYQAVPGAKGVYEIVFEHNGKTYWNGDQCYLDPMGFLPIVSHAVHTVFEMSGKKGRPRVIGRRYLFPWEFPNELFDLAAMRLAKRERAEILESILPPAAPARRPNRL